MRAQLQIIVRNALERRQLERERQRLHDELAESHRMLAQQVRELEASSDAMQRDLRRAEIIQRVLLPNEPPPLDGLCLHTVYRPGRFVGGDMYNVVRLTDRYLAFYVADATGHGVSSAMLSVLFHRKLVLTDQQTGAPLSPEHVLATVNRSICAERMAPGLFLTAAYCLLDTATNHATIALAGHPPAMLHHEDGSVQTFQRTGPALGLTADAVYRDEAFVVQPGDRLLLYTDGLMDIVPDAAAARALLESLLNIRDQGGDAILTQLADAAHGAAEARDDDRDDVTLLLLEARAGASRFDNGASKAVGSVSSGNGRAAVVFYGESESRSFLVVRGRGNWMSADAFHGAVASLLDEGVPVVVDLSECEYLDSTFLGTMHELSGRVGTHVKLELQNVSPAVRALFEELDMHRVIASIRAEALPVPETRQMATVGEEEGPHARILHAHESLATLSDRNQERFRSVVDAMRAQGAR